MRQHTINLVLKLNQKHQFLEPGESPQLFCTDFDFGTVAEHYRAIFFKQPVWWNNESCFAAGMRLGLPSKLKPFLYVLCFKLSKPNIGDSYSLNACVHDWKKSKFPNLQLTMLFSKKESQ